MFKIDPLSSLTTQSVNGLENVVTSLDWYYESTIEGCVYRVHGPAIDLPTPSGESFIPFESLSESQVNTWILDNLSEAARQFYIDKIDIAEEALVVSLGKWDDEAAEWDTEQQQKLEAGEIEELKAYPEFKPIRGTSNDIFATYTEVNELAQPWAN